MTTLLMNPPNHSQHFPPITHPHTATSRTNRQNRGMNNPLLRSTSLQDTCMATALQEGSKGEWFRGVNFALRHPDRMRAANEVDHLARAIMHVNYLAGLLPFFEPSIEWDDPTLDHQFRTGRPNHASRSLHTFVPLPASSSSPTMVSHGGIPSHMIEP